MCVERSVALSKKIRGPDSQGYIYDLPVSVHSMLAMDRQFTGGQNVWGIFFLFADPPHLNLIPLDQIDSL